MAERIGRPKRPKNIYPTSDVLGLKYGRFEKVTVKDGGRTRIKYRCLHIANSGPYKGKQR
jgi:hypothetical protein